MTDQRPNKHSYKAYPSYKDSGIEWIGKIPEEWSTQRIKYSSYLKGRIGWHGLTSDEHVDEGPFLVTGTDFLDGKVNWETCYHVSERRYLQDPYIMLRNGDLLVTKDGSIGKVARVENLPAKATLNSGIFLIRPLDEHYLSKFMFWVLGSSLFKDYIDYVKAGSTISHLYQYVFDEFTYSIPSIIEQHAIAAFLDRETARIDALVEKKERQIELLKEKRSTLISHVVTKGLNPDTPMKDSGIEWLGEIPKHWDVIRVKALEGNNAEVVQTGPFGAQLHANDYVDEGIPLVLIRNVENLRIDDTDIPRITSEDAERLSMYRLEVGDIVFSRVGSIGRIAICTEREKGWLISGQMLRIRISNPKLKINYSVYAFSSVEVLTYIDLRSVGSTRESINTDILRNMPLPIPPTEEQRAIAAFLDREICRIASLIEKVEGSINKLREYRTTLISAAVTGKIDLRGEVA